MLPFQTLKNQLDKILVKYRRETGKDFKVGQHATNKMNELLETFLTELIELSVDYTEHAGRKVIKSRDIELAWMVLHGRR